MTIRIPDSDPDWEGSLDVDLTIDKATVIATAKPVSTETYAGEPVKCNIEATGFIEGEKDSWTKKPTVKVVEGDVNKAGTYKVQAAGGDAGNNYDIKIRRGCYSQCTGRKKACDQQREVWQEGYIHCEIYRRTDSSNCDGDM